MSQHVDRSKGLDISDLPELSALNAPKRLVRVPPELNVPLTDRVARLLDTPEMQRLARVSQLGLVRMVYPGATHSRLEHSLGVYRNALLFLSRLGCNSRFTEIVDAGAAKTFLLAALLHDVGHWPFCHPIEDMARPDVPEHESRAHDLITGSSIGHLIRDDWDTDPEQVAALLFQQPQTDTDRLLASLLSGPIDVDKMDYLVRDSHHAGVPYGRNFDASRLTEALTVHPTQPRLAITEKGRTAAEMMVFSRYIMFSEVYWHHAVRSGTAMLQRALFLLEDRLDLDAMYELDEAAWIGRLRRMASGTLTVPLAEGLFGLKRSLYKRAGQFSVLDHPDLHQALARRPYEWLVKCSDRLAQHLAARIGLPLGVADILIDAPPAKLEVDINVDIVERGGTERTLGDVSPVAAALARQQFDNFVKRVRVFVRPDLREHLDDDVVMQSLHQAIEDCS